ncbi:MAG: glycosyltransferase family 4 protein [Desulfobacterales bacterium]|nr:glycosyltransferase family 4 protein [Desulfobacterales bacterium]MDX2512525.1 glycosyltransferase family 4 protein [Desulfobacterales bacterium]
MAHLKILHVIGQRPEMTGSGFYLESIIRESEKHGFSNYRVAGVPAGTDRPSNVMHGNACADVFFDSESLNFSVPGMSDVMPYKSSLFKELKGKRLTAYKAAFTHVLQTAVSRFDPDIIHTNHLFLLSALVRKLYPNMPIVATCHGTDLRQYNNCRHLRSYVKRYCRDLEKVIALTNDQKKDISRLYGISPKNIVVVGGGYDDTLFTRAPKPTPGTVHILYAGKFNRSKGVIWLLKSLNRINHHDWHLHMAGSGSGPEYNHCMDLAEKLGPKVTNHGYVGHPFLAELMQKAHIQVLPSFFEGLPLVLFEGLASGCRIITTRLSGFDEIFGRTKKDTIDLIQLPPLETIDTPYQKDENYLESVLSKSILKMMSALKNNPDFDDPEAEKIASHYTWKRVFERTLLVYKDVIRF